MSPRGAHPRHSGETESPIVPRGLRDAGSIIPAIRPAPPLRFVLRTTLPCGDASRSVPTGSTAPLCVPASFEDLPDAGGDGLAELAVFLSFEVDAVEVAGDDDGAGVEKVAAGLFGETAVVFGEPYGLLRGPLE